MNITITVPEGTTNHGDPGLLCTPAQWHDYLAFFFGNYVAHAATIVPVPGQSMSYSFFSILMALLLPGSAIVRSVTVIIRRPAIERKNPLMCAARAGALCIVLKRPPKSPAKDKKERESDIERDGNSLVDNDWANSTSSLLKTETFQLLEMEDRAAPLRKLVKHQPIPKIPQPPGEWWNPSGGYAEVESEQIHGEYWLHKSYYLAVVPPTNIPTLQLSAGQRTQTTNLSSLTQPPALLSSSHNLLKLCISLIQSLWAVITVYRSRGDQIQQYGYAAFGLTVAPYAVMSIINTVANMLTKEYPAIFVLRTPFLTQLEAEGKAYFNGALDVVTSPSPSLESSTKQSGFGAWVDRKFLPKPGLQKQGNQFFKPITLLSLLLSLIPLAIVGGLSGFQSGNSTQMQRGFTMSWLILGIFYGVLLEASLVYEKKEVSGYVEEEEEEGSKRGAEDRLLEVHSRQETGEEKAKKGGFDFVDFFVICLSGLMIIVLLGAPVIGGMVMVGRMIGEFGVCTLLKD